MPTLSLLGVAAVTTMLALGPVAGSAVEAAGGSTPSPGKPGPRLERVCSRIPDRIARLERLHHRLRADVRTPGSLAFLQARIERAKGAGRTDQARLLSDRLAVRKELDGSVPRLLTHLKDAREVCAALSSGSSS